MIRSTNLQREITKKSLLKLGEFVELVHYSGDATYGGEYNQVPTYVSGVSTVCCRAVPIQKEIRFGEQTYGIDDVQGWLPYDVTVGIHDEITFDGTNTFSGTYVVDAVRSYEPSINVFLKIKSGT